jgi:hypothetical protein
MGIASGNDVWTNGGPAYVGITTAESNLELDPLYCMPSAGDFELRSDSPCAPAGVFGQIGARGVGCSPTTGVPAGPSLAGTLRIAPNPVRDEVSFAISTGARLDDLAIFDLQGRRRWAGSSAAPHLRWDGRASSGERLTAGIYLVRWRAGTRTGASRLVLLDP